MFGVTRDTYNKRKKAIDYKRSQASCVISLVQEICNIMPRLGGSKLYYMLENKLSKWGISR